MYEDCLNKTPGWGIIHMGIIIPSSDKYVDTIPTRDGATDYQH